jgi:hypothetical protein
MGYGMPETAILPGGTLSTDDPDVAQHDFAAFRCPRFSDYDLPDDDVTKGIHITRRRCLCVACPA